MLSRCSHTTDFYMFCHIFSLLHLPASYSNKWSANSLVLYFSSFLLPANIEDSEEGKHELLCYRVGVSHQFPELGYTNVRKRAKYDDHTRWKEDIKKFHGKVYKLWSMLDYKAHVSWVVTANVMSSFANCTNTSGVFRLRAPEDLKLLAPFFWTKATRSWHCRGTQKWSACTLPQTGSHHNSQRKNCHQQH